MVQVDASSKFPDLRPVRSDPPLYHVFGFGLYLYGERDFDLETESFVRTLCFCLMYIPVFALRSYRVVPTDDGWRYLGRVPVSDSDRLLSVFVTVAILVGCGYYGVNAYFNSPGYVASQKMALAERRASEGHIGEAASLLADVAVGPTALDRAAAKQLAMLLDSASSKSKSEGLGDAFRAAMGVHKAGRWQGSAQTLRDSGVSLAKETAAKDPAGAWAILDAVAPLAPQDQAMAGFRHELLEKVVAADPANVDWASRLALDCESKGDLERCEKILAPLRPRLGELEGARILGLVDARANRPDQAVPLLRAYTKNRLERLRLAETKLRSLYSEAQKRILGQLETGRVADFSYESYRVAGPKDRENILIQYLESKVKNDVAIARAKEEVIAESNVVPAVMEFGMVLLQQSQAQADPQARKSLLNEAEATFLAVSQTAGDQDEYQLSLAQVYYWQGKHSEGRKLFDEVLKSHNRDPALLLEVATLLRNIGSTSDARTLAEEGFNKASDLRVKNHCAVIRGLLSEDIEESILWLRRANSNDAHVKAILCGNLATQALNKGDEALAISNLKEAIRLYDGMPESSASLNNSSTALLRLAGITGDNAAFERAGTSIARAAALDPGNSLTLSNASTTLLETGLRDVIGNQIDLKLIKGSAGVELLGFLVKNDSERQAMAAKLRSQSAVNRALSLMDKVILLAPRNSSSYEAGMGVLVFRDDVEGLRRIRSRLQGITLDLEAETKKMLEIYAGKKDDWMREFVKAALAKIEPILPVARAKGGPTFAAAASRALQNRMSAPNYGIAVDRDAMVALAEEAFSAAPSLASRWCVFDALLFRATDRMSRANPGFAALRDRSVRSLSSEELVGAVLSKPGPLKELALKDPDVCRAIDILRDSYAESPFYTAAPTSWILFRDKYPEVANDLAKLYLSDNAERLKDELRAELRPFDPTPTLKAYWTAHMRNKEAEGLKILAQARSRGVPLPIGPP